MALKLVFLYAYYNAHFEDKHNRVLWTYFLLLLWFFSFILN